MPTQWSDLCLHGEWQCYDPRHWFCHMSNTACHDFVIVGGVVPVCRYCGKTEWFLSSDLIKRLKE